MLIMAMTTAAVTTSIRMTTMSNGTSTTVPGKRSIETNAGTDCLPYFFAAVVVPAVDDVSDCATPNTDSCCFHRCFCLSSSNFAAVSKYDVGILLNYCSTGQCCTVQYSTVL